MRSAKRRRTLKPSSRSVHYRKCKAEWEKRRAERKAQFAESQSASAESGGDWLVDPPELPVKPVLLLATLRSLGYRLQDRRYHELCRELFNSGLIERKLKSGKIKRSKWSWSRPKLALANPETRLMCELIEEAIARREFTEREAIADAVKELGLDAPSFGTACKRVKRLLDAYRQSRETETPLNLSHAKPENV
jgi:hypothetical protein